MSVVLYHHPYSRAANTVWMLEEVGVPYELRFVDIMKGEQKTPDFIAQNPMGKLPLIKDGDVTVSESAAIGLYLADRYASGTLAPALDSPDRGAYLRWSLFAPSVIEPAAMAHSSGWKVKEGAAGFGTYEAMLASVTAAISKSPFLLGDNFTMADLIFGGTVAFMLRFKMIDERPGFAEYAARLAARPAAIRAEAINAKSAQEHGLK